MTIKEILNKCMLSSILSDANSDDLMEIRAKQDINTRNRLTLVGAIFIFIELVYLISDLATGFYGKNPLNLLNMSAVLIMLISSILVVSYSILIKTRKNKLVQYVAFIYSLLIEAGIILFLASDLLKGHDDYLLVFFNLMLICLIPIYRFPLLVATQILGIIAIYTTIYLAVPDKPFWSYKQTTLIIIGCIIATHYLRIVKTKGIYQQLKLEHISKEFENISNRDFLTQLSNRTALDAYLKNEITEAMHNNKCLSLTMLDIDDFKAYNDHYSHMQGDVCLRRIAQELLKRNNKKFHAFRYGGEEFLIVGIDITEEELNELNSSVLSDIRALRLDRKEVRSVKDYVTVSIGSSRGKVSSYADFMNLLKLSDNRLYESKKTGKNKITDR